MLKNTYIKFPLILALFGVLSTLLLAVVYQITLPIIERNANAAEYAAIEELFEGDISTSTADISAYSAIIKLYEVKDGSNVVAYVYKAKGTGYKGATNIYLIGISPAGNFVGFKAIDLTEQTAGIGTRIDTPEFSDQFVNKSIATGISVLGGASRTSEGAITAITAAVSHFNAVLD